MEVKAGFWDQEKVSLSPIQRSPFTRGSRYKDYVNIFLRPNFGSPEWSCPLNKAIPWRGSIVFPLSVLPSKSRAPHLLEGCVSTFLL